MLSDALEPVRATAEFWRRDDVLNALDARDIGALFRLLRQHTGASQTRIGIAVGMPQSEISLIMSAGPRRRNVTALNVMARIAEGIGMPADACERLGVALRATPGAISATHDLSKVAVLSEDVRRRAFVAGGVAAAASFVWLREPHQPVGRVGASDAIRLRRQTERLHSLDQQHGGDTLWHAARALVGSAYLMLDQGTYSDESGRQLLDATGRILICAGWLAFDAGRQDVARSFYNEALSAAHQGGNAELQVRALANLAFQSNVLQRPREGSRYARAAATVAKAAYAARVAAIPQLRLAMASAATDDRQGSDEAIRQARLAMDRDADMGIDNGSSWSTFLGSGEMDGVEGTCAIGLGRPQRAQQLLESAIRAHDDRHTRNRALYRVRLACARLDSGAADGAAEAANAALDDLSGNVASWRVAGELQGVATRLLPFRGVNSVDDFLHRFGERRDDPG